MNKYYPKVGDIVAYKETPNCYYTVTAVDGNFMQFIETQDYWVNVEGCEFLLVQRNYVNVVKSVSDSVDNFLVKAIDYAVEDFSEQIKTISLEPLLATLRYAESVDKKTKTDWSKTI